MTNIEQMKALFNEEKEDRLISELEEDIANCKYVLEQIHPFMGFYVEVEDPNQANIFVYQVDGEKVIGYRTPPGFNWNIDFNDPPPNVVAARATEFSVDVPVVDTKTYEFTYWKPGLYRFINVRSRMFRNAANIESIKQRLNAKRKHDLTFSPKKWRSK